MKIQGKDLIFISQIKDGDKMSIDELLTEFKRQGIDTSNWDGEEGAEKAIVDGVMNLLNEIFNAAREKHFVTKYAPSILKYQSVKQFLESKENPK